MPIPAVSPVAALTWARNGRHGGKPLLKLPSGEALREGKLAELRT